jgi:hypothetical protein
MTGITLNAEQIRGAPPDVRRWIEHELASSLGLHTPANESPPQVPQLATCGHDELLTVLSLIQGEFVAVNVLFELGRNGTSFARNRLQAYRLSDVQHHIRLRSRQQVISSLDLIDGAFHRVRGSSQASFYGTDGSYCFIAMDTQQNIRGLWIELLDCGESAGLPAAAIADGNGAALEDAVPAGDRLTGSSNPGVQPLQS